MLALVEGWTEDIDYILDIDGTVQNLSGMSVALQARDANKTTLSLSGSVSIADAATGKVRFSPAAADIKVSNSPMLIRWQVTDSGGKIAYFPNEGWERWVVRK